MRSFSTVLFALASLAPCGRAMAQENPEAVPAEGPLLPSERWLSHDVAGRFQKRPLTMHRPLFDGVVAPGGPNFVVATDDDGSLLATHWYDGGEAYNGVQTLEQKYHELAPDNVQFIVTFTSWRLQNFGAFYWPLANDVSGIGYENEGPEIFDNTGASPLEGQLVMNSLDTFGFGADAAWVFNQELGHRWGSFVRYSLDGKRSDSLLGRDLQHWSYFLDTGFSPLEGNAWRDNRNGSFTTTTMGDHPLFSPLDLYLMGFVPERDVPPMTLILPAAAQVDDGSGNLVDRASQPQTGKRSATVMGGARTVSIQEVIKAEGKRSPKWDVSPREFHIGFMFMVKPGQETNRSLLFQMEKRVEDAVAGWEYATGGRAHLIVESHGVNPQHNPAGTPCPSGFLQCDPKRTTACIAPLAGSLSDAGVGVAAAPAVCAVACEGGQCASGCCLPGTDGSSYCFDRAFCGADAGAKLAALAPGCSIIGARAPTGGTSGLQLFGVGLAVGGLVLGAKRRRRHSVR